MNRPSLLQSATRAGVVMLMAVAAGCSDYGDAPEDAGGIVEPPPPSVSFAADVQPIFDANCVGCHGAVGNADLTLLAGQSHANLVGVVATESDLARIHPGEPDSSWLYLKITDGQDFGTHMPPPPLPLLPDSAREAIRTWIEEGALDN